MRIIIKGKQVTFDDGTGNFVIMSTAQLIEIFKILNISITPEGDFRFNQLEFSV